jgi:DNA topoisomerase-2
MEDLGSKYRKHTHREHILELPDTYIGSIETHPHEVYVVDGEAFVPRECAINPGFYKLVDELLVNAHDQVIRLRQRGSEQPVKSIEAEWKDGVFTLRNDGESIDVEEHPEHKVYIPELIFSQLLTSTNYDKAEKKLVGGKNGYGVKLVNIFAKAMTVTIVDGKRQRK